MEGMIVLIRLIFFVALLLFSSCYNLITIDPTNVERTGWIRLEGNGLRGFLGHAFNNQSNLGERDGVYVNSSLMPYYGDIAFGVALKIKEDPFIRFIYFSPKFWEWLRSTRSKKIGLDSFMTFIRVAGR